MATHAPAAPATRLVIPVDALVRHGLWLAVAATVAIRVAALAIFARPLESDGLAYFTLAKSLAETGVMTDHFGLHAFYSPGYPLLLAPVFALLGAGSSIGHSVNVALAGIAAGLVWQLVRALGGGRGAALIGGLLYAVWLPGIWLTTDFARENLSVPLLLGFALACVRIAQDRADLRTVALAGLLYGAGLLAGSSVVLTGGALVIALVLGLRRPEAVIGRITLFAVAGLLVLAPWFVASNAMLGRPVLTTNTAFNLYIGNNPAATGRFVSVAETPVAPVWHARVATLGELGVSDWLADETARWVMAHPGRTAALAAKKLALFWAPNVPDADDFARTPLLAALRGIEVVQYLAILVFAAAALGARRIDRRARWTLATLIAGFWLIHAAAYIIARYRDPAVPVLIALAALAVAHVGRRWSRPA